MVGDVGCASGLARLGSGVMKLFRKSAGEKERASQQLTFAVLTALTTTQAKDAALLVAKCFAEAEPLGVGLNITASEMLPMIQALVERTAPQALSSICCDRGRVVGIMISEDLLAPLLPENDPLIVDNIIPMDKFGKIFALLEDLDAQLLSSLKTPPVPREIFHQFMVAVDPMYSGRNIASDLMGHNLKVGSDAGFKLAIIEPTGKFSQKASRKNGFTLFAQTAGYEEVVQNGDRPFAGVVKKTGHTHCELLTKVL